MIAQDLGGVSAQYERKFIADQRYTIAIVLLIFAAVISADTYYHFGGVDLVEPHVMLWMVALAFPFTAVLYVFFRLRVRLFEIDEVFRANDLYRVFAPQAPGNEFGSVLLPLFYKYYSFVELTCFSVVAGVIVYQEGYIITHDVLGLNKSGMAGLAALAPMQWILAGGFVGSICGSLSLVAGKYSSFDIYPCTYLEVAIATIVGTLFGFGVTPLFEGNTARFISFAGGFFAAANVDLLWQLLSQQFARLSGVSVTPPIPSDLDRVIRNTSAIDSMKPLGIHSISEFVETSPIRIYFNVPQSVGVINQWIDEALLAYNFGTILDKLNAVHIHRFTDLLDRVVETIEATATRWRANAVITGDQCIDEALAVALQAIIDSKRHHRQLGVLYSRYRDAHF